MAEHVVLHSYTALQIGAIRFISVFRGERTKPQTAIQIIRILFPSSIYLARNALHLARFNFNSNHTLIRIYTILIE